MLDTIGAGVMVMPWGGIWDLIWQSPENTLGLLAALIGLVLVGGSLASIGRKYGEEEPRKALVVVSKSQRALRQARRAPGRLAATSRPARGAA